MQETLPTPQKGQVWQKRWVTKCGGGKKSCVCQTINAPNPFPNTRAPLIKSFETELGEAGVSRWIEG